MKRMVHISTIVLLSVLLVAGCEPTPTPTPTPTATTAPTATPPPVPTATNTSVPPTATSTPEPTGTPGPSPTPSPWTHLSSAVGDLEAPGDITRQTCAVVADFDGDGDDDFAIGGRQSIPSLYWWRRGEDGWVRHVVADSYLQLEAGMVAADVDGDGDLDIIAACDYQCNSIWWWENPHPDHDPEAGWARRTVKETGPKKHHDMAWGDVDGDGQGELVVWNQSGWDEERITYLYVVEVPTAPTGAGEWPRTTVFQSTNYYEGLAIADVNQDGQDDIVGGGMWFEHMGGTDYLPHVLAEGTFRRPRVAVGDVIPGGWLEILLVSADHVDGELRLYEWWDGEWFVRVLLTGVHYGHSLELADFDGDGYLDVFAAEMRYTNPAPEDAATWVLYGDGNGSFTPAVIAYGYEHHDSQVGDLDGDGDMDILGKPYNWDTPRVDVWLNGGAP